MKKNKKDLYLDNSLRIIVKSSIFVFIGIVISKILSYAYRAVIARYFGPEVYGLFSIAIMIEGWFVAFSILGLTEGVLRDVSILRGKKELNKIKYLFKLCLAALTVSSLIAGAILFFLSDYISINLFHNEKLTIFLKIFSIIIPVGVISKSFMAVIQAYEKIEWQSFILNILQNVVKLSSIAFLIFIGFNSNSVAWSYLLGVGSILIASYLVCKYKIPEVFGKYYLKKEVKSSLRRNLFSYSWPVLFSVVIVSIFYWIDSFMIGYYRGVTEVGFYNAALPIALLLGFGSELFLYIFFPLINKEYAKKNFGIIKQLSQQLGKWIFILNLPLFILIMLYPGAFIKILFGSEYLVAENSLRILAVSALFNSIFYISNRLISMTGKSKIIFYDMFIAALLNIVLNAILIQKYGINGAALATTISLVLLNLFFIYQSHKYLSIVPVRRKMLRILVVSLIPTLLLIFFRNSIEIVNVLSLILLASFFIVFYVFLIISTGCLDRNDFMILNSIKNKLKLKK